MWISFFHNSHIRTFGSCGDDGTPKVVIDNPETYSFTRNGESTVSFSGQTTQIAMGEEIIDALKGNTLTESQIDGMFVHEEKGTDFSDSKKVFPTCLGSVTMVCSGFFVCCQIVSNRTLRCDTVYGCSKISGFHGFHVKKYPIFLMSL